MRNHHYLSLGVLAGILCSSGSEAAACLCNRVYTSYYVDCCATCPSSPVQSCVPQTTCATTTVQRCYWVPENTYRTMTRLEPRAVYVRRSYYDPLTCCYRSYYAPSTQFVQVSYQVPVTSYVQRWVEEPQTVCTTPHVQPAGNGTTTPSQNWRTPSTLERPIYREPLDSKQQPSSPPPPKPIPMPAPSGSSARSRATSVLAPGLQN